MKYYKYYYEANNYYKAISSRNSIWRIIYKLYEELCKKYTENVLNMYLKRPENILKIWHERIAPDLYLI